MNNQLRVRVAILGDLESAMQVYATAREFMKRTGNPTQWGNWYPPKEYLLEDIGLKRLYVVLQDETIVGAFMFAIGCDPNYAIIENGKWRKNIDYGFIHRVASNGKVKGVFSTVLSFALSQTDYIRIDTHSDNVVMQSTLKKHGFKPCGTVYMLDDGTPRIAFDYIKE